MRQLWAGRKPPKDRLMEGHMQGKCIHADCPPQLANAAWKINPQKNENHNSWTRKTSVKPNCMILCCRTITASYTCFDCHQYPTCRDLQQKLKESSRTHYYQLQSGVYESVVQIAPSWYTRVSQFDGYQKPKPCHSEVCKQINSCKTLQGTRSLRWGDDERFTSKPA